METRVFDPPARFRIIETIAKAKSFARVYPVAEEQLLWVTTTLRDLLASDRRTLIGEHLSKHASRDWR